VWDKALTYCRQAGEKAVARSAYREAVECFEQALGALQHLPETRDTHEQAIDIRLALRNALHPSRNPERILTLLREAEILAEGLDDPQRLGQVSIFLAVYFYYRGAYDQAIAAGQRALALATACGEGVLHALANYYLSIIYYFQGDYRQAIDCSSQAVASLEGARRNEAFGFFLPTVVSRAVLAWCYAESGTFAEGRALGEEGLQVGEAVAHPASIMFAAWGLGLLFLRQGDLPRALPQLERAMGLCQDAALSAFFPRMAATLGEAYALGGRIADAMALLMQAQAIDRTPAREGDLAGFQALYHLSLGEVQLLAGCLEEAHDFAEHALALARQHQERGNQAYALHLLGDIMARHDPLKTERAEEYFRQALALAEELGMRPLVAHCHRGLGTLYAVTGQREQARTALSTAIELYRGMDMTFWLPQAEATLAQVEGR
jgi:tetratricopeptide (TPR) repeat protein